MNKRIRELAEQAGFVLWSDCDWKPRGEVIDWASNYDKELGAFAELVWQDEREACAKLVMPLDESLADEIRARGDASDISEKYVHESDKDRHEFDDLYDIWVEHKEKTND